MNNWIPSPEFEEKVKKSYQIPEVRQEFVQALKLRLKTLEPSKPRKSLSGKKMNPAWVVGMLLLALTLMVTLVVGPQEVWAAIGRLFGYIPGVGLVDDDQEFRVLAEPVSITRDGVTVSVTNALLSNEKTVVLFSIDNVPWESLSHDENIHGCYSTPELRLPNGVNLSIWSGGGGMGNYRFEYPPVDQDVNIVEFFLPCITETLPGLAPENWELLLSFVPAPDDLEIIPVFEVPLPTISREADLEKNLQPILILKALEIGDVYTLFVEFDPSMDSDNSTSEGIWQLNEPPALIDGSGNAVFYQIPNDLEPPAPSRPGVQVYSFQFSKAIKPPLSITFTGVKVSKIGDQKSFKIAFDPGEDPRAGQEWQIDEPLSIEGYKTILTSIIAGTNGYSFQFDHGESSDLQKGNAHNVTVEEITIEGFNAIGGGGGGGGGGPTGRVIGNLSLDYESIPTGMLSLDLKTQLYQSSEQQSWTLEWAPESMSESLFNIRPVVDRWLVDENGFILLGHIEWLDDRIANVSEFGNMRALDKNGNLLDLEKLTFAETTILLENLQANQWAYRLRDKDVQWPITLRLEKVNLEFAQPIRYSLDLRPYGFTFGNEQVGLGWKLGLQPLDIPGISANMFRATYFREGGFSGFGFEIMADSRLQNLGLDFENEVVGETQARQHRVRLNEANGALVITILTDGQLKMPLNLVAHGVDILGSWEGSFSP